MSLRTGFAPTAPFTSRPDVRVKVTYLLVLAAYAVGAFSFAATDYDAAVIFAILVPLSAIFVYAAVASKHLTLTLFALFFFVANGLSPAFFFLERETYSYSGWGAVGNFDFSVGSYLTVAAPVFALMAVVSVTCILTTKVSLRATPARVSAMPTKRWTEPVERKRTGSRRSSALLIAFTLFIAIPLSLFMFSKGIGLVGVDNVTRLPFRLSGILYYVRYFVVPIILFYLYAKSSRSLALVPFILGYAGIAGVTSVSRSLLMLSAVSVPVYAYLDRKYTRLIVSVAVILSLYAIVTAARVFVYSFEDLNLFALITGSQLPTLETIAAISSRLGGAQDNVLAYQYDFPNPLHGIINFFLGRPIIENYALELYGFNLPEGMAFGVGFTLFPSLLMIAGKNPILIVLVASAVGFLLVLFEKLVRVYMALRVQAFALSGYPLAFLLVFTLFGANFRPLYFFLIFSSLAVAGYRVLEVARRI